MTPDLASDLLAMSASNLAFARADLRARARRLRRKGPPHMLRRRRGEAVALLNQATMWARAARDLRAEADARIGPSHHLEMLYHFHHFPFGR